MFRILCAIAVVWLAASAPAAAQASAVPGSRELVEEFLTGPDAATVRGTMVAALDAATLAALAEPAAPRATHGVLIVNNTATTPPTRALVVMPACAVPPGGFPSITVFEQAPAGPEEAGLRGRFGAWLSAGWALVAPIPPHAGHGRPAAALANADSGLLPALLAAAERVAMLNPARRAVHVSAAAAAMPPDQVPRTVSAFALLHVTAHSEEHATTFPEPDTLTPAVVVFHHGLRVGEAAGFFWEAARAHGLAVFDQPDSALDYQRRAYFTDAAIRQVASRMPDSRPTPDAATVVVRSTAPPEGSPLVVQATRWAGRLQVRGLTTQSWNVTCDPPLVAGSEVSVFVPVFGARGALTDWRSESSWTGPALPTPRILTSGATTTVVDDDPTRLGRALACRAQARFGHAVTGMIHLRLSPP